MKYKVILWDFDGTLADTGADVWDSLEYAAGKLGGSMDETFRSCDSNLGKPMEEIFRQVHPFPGEEKLSTFDEWVTIHYRTISEYPKTEFYPGIHGILEEARAQGVRNYIITLKPEEALLRILRKKGWSELFEGCFSPDSFGEEIRSKAQVIADVMASGQMERETTVYIGDTFSDVTAAHANNIPCIGVTYGDGDTEKLLEAGPDFLARNGEELKKRLEEEDKEAYVE